MKKQLRSIRLNNDNEMLIALEQVSRKKIFEDWFIQMHKCIDAEGQYFKKIY